MTFYVRQQSAAIMNENHFAMGALLLCSATSTAAWLTHVYVCFSEQSWGFLIAGAIFFPVGIVHGIGIWFGVWH